MVEKPTYEELEKRLKELEGGNDERERAREFMQRVIDGFPDAIMVINRDYTIALANRAACEIAGDKDPVAAGMKCHQLSHNSSKPHEGANDSCPLKQTFATKSPVTVEHIHHDATGHAVDVEIVAVPIFDNEGEVVQIIFSRREITERRQAEDALRKSEERYRLLFNSLPCGGEVIDTDGRIVSCAPNTARMLGYEVSELIGRHITELLDPNSIDVFHQKFPQLLSGEPTSADIRMIRKDGTKVNILRAAQPIMDDNGKVEAVLALNMDITERKQAEEALRTAHDKLEATLNALPDLLFEIDSEGRILDYRAPHLEELLVPPETFLGKTVAEVIPEPAAGIIGEAIRQALETGRSKGATYALEMSGQTRWFELSIVRSGALETSKVRLIILVRDITERKNAEDKIAASLREKEVFLREIHHRVKNNMQVIVSLLRMHSRRTDDSRLGQVFDDCRDRVNAMALIHEALYESENLAQINFAVYLKKLCRNLHKAYRALNKEVIVSVERCDVVLNMDHGVAIGLVICELVSNALKHAFPHRKTGAVSISLSTLKGNEVKLVVQDNGRGLSREVDILNSSSLGLRLVVATATKELNGSIEVERDGGTRFIIRFKC